MQTGEVKAALRRHYKTTEYALMFEVGNATGSNVRRHADAVVMNLWPSRGLLIEGIEIKVSRSDWRREIENPAKAEEIAKFCDRWWVVTPAGIVQDHELPFNWGHMIVSEKGIRVAKQAPKLDPVDLTRGFVAAMLRRASDADAAMVERLVAKQVVEREGKLAEAIEKGVEQRTKSFARVEDKVAKLKEAGLDLESHWETADEIIRAYKLGKSLRDSYAISGLNHKADALVTVAETLRSVHNTLFAEERVQ